MFCGPSQALKPLLEGAAIQEHAPSTPQALDSYICTDAHYPPLVASTWVRLAQPSHVPNDDVNRHATRLRNPLHSRQACFGQYLCKQVRPVGDDDLHSPLD